jgi:hypothetical protein
MANAEPVALTLAAAGDGDGVRLTWRPDALEGSEARQGASPWDLEEGIDWKRAEALRLVSAVFDDGRKLAVAALRPRAAAGHDADSVASHLVQEGEPVTVTEALVSTEYDADGLPRRVGLELWTHAEPAPLRVAGDREGAPELSGQGVRRQATRMSFRLEGEVGRGLYEIVRPA